MTKKKVEAKVEIVSDVKNTCSLLAAKPEGKTPFGMSKYIILRRVIVKRIFSSQVFYEVNCMHLACDVMSYHVTAHMVLAVLQKTVNSLTT